MHSKHVSRREVLTGVGGTLGGLALGGVLPARPTPLSTVAIGRCRSYREDLAGKLGTLFDQIGGIGPLVKGKTVALKLNLTGQPQRFPIDPELPYRTNPDTVLATAHLLARAGARRIRILETFFPARQDMDLWARYQLDIQAINNVGCKVEWENAQNLGYGKKYVTVKVPGQPYLFPAYELNHSWVDCDTYVSLSKLKNHWIAGVTLSLKNNFGITPCSLYGGDCGPSGNENPTKERAPVCHSGTTPPPAGVPTELDPASPRDPGYRVPRIVADLVRVRPIDLAIIDGVESIRGGEGVWNPGVQKISAGVLLAGKNPVCLDAVAMAVMGYDPKAGRGVKPFVRGDSALKLAEAAGVGSTDLARIEVAGLSVREALCDYGPGPIGRKI
ncbi:MAG TPA: DUF362 domain-containing protein [Bryobacteraceae bacterium]|nr:DUF362 domain-containing protein [Bryobacteraceae bacterium]